ncbi:MAG: hypothetical protein U0452_12075 [Anaerolineae bacterium]
MIKTTDRRIIPVLIAAVLMILVFWISPWEDADDWETYYYAARRLVAVDVPLYGTLITDNYYSNPPWLAASLVPVTLLPPKFGWALLSAGTLAVALLILRKWVSSPDLVRIISVLASPPMMYILLHGQIDVIVIGAVLLPAWVWPVAAITKPQVAIGLLFGIPRRQWLRAGIFVGLLFVISFLIWGLWPLELLRQPTPFVGAGHNLWAGLWPFQVPLGVLFLVLGISRKDERFLIAGSPFLSPYAALSTMIGPWIVAVSFLKTWQVAAVWASWWGAVLYRGWVG